MSWLRDNDWEWNPKNYKHNPDLVAFVEYQQEEIKHLYTYTSELERANETMMRLIQLNDKKQALMEASPEFAEALVKIEQEKQLPPT